jgi:CDP-diacylglycerol--serine O-phosphatidyltransferase
MSALWIALIAGTSFLMVSSWRFWSAKGLNVSERQPVRSVLMIAVFFTLVIALSRYALIIIAMFYLVSGVVARVLYSWGKRLT